MKYEITSDILGKTIVTQMIQVQQPVDRSNSFVFDFFGSFVDQLKGMKGEDWEEPSMKLVKVSEQGLATISFSASFIVLDDFSVLESTYIDKDGKERNSIDLAIEPEDDQEEIELEFSWTVVTFTAKQMQIQLFFEDLTAISTSITPNSLVLTVNNRDLFRRAVDAFPVSDKELITEAVLTKQITDDETAIVKIATRSVVGTGSSVVFMALVLQFFLGYGVNNVLS